MPAEGAGRDRGGAGTGARGGAAGQGLGGSGDPPGANGCRVPAVGPALAGIPEGARSLSPPQAGPELVLPAIHGGAAKASVSGAPGTASWGCSAVLLCKIENKSGCVRVCVQVQSAQSPSHPPHPDMNLSNFKNVEQLAPLEQRVLLEGLFSLIKAQEAYKLIKSTLVNSRADSAPPSGMKEEANPLYTVPTKSHVSAMGFTKTLQVKKNPLLIQTSWVSSRIYHQDSSSRQDCPCVQVPSAPTRVGPVLTHVPPGDGAVVVGRR